MTNPERSEKSHLWLARFWVANLILATVCFFYDQELWQKISVYYLVMVSIIALVATEYGNAKAAKAARIGEDNLLKRFFRRFK